MTDSEWTNLKTQVQETHDAIVRLETRFNGGPGTWPPCIAHTETMRDHEARMRYMEGRIFRALGGVGLIALLAAVASIFAALNS